MGTNRSHLAKLIRDARLSKDWSQDDLKAKLGLARAISISKWERGEAPVPVHHWLELMRVLAIPRELFLEAATKDHHRQFDMFSTITESVKESAGDIGSFSWDFIVRSLAPDLAYRVEVLRGEYKGLTAAEFARAACQYFVEQARFGLDRNNRPIHVTRGAPALPSPGVSGQKPTRVPRPKPSHR